MAFIRPLSDIHNEFSVFDLPVTEFDSRAVLVLAGDIGLAKSGSSLENFLDSVTERFTDILYIPGNHEYYRGSFQRTEGKLMDLCNRYLNVHYMNKKTMFIDGIRYIGATLWTDFNGANPMAMLAAEEAMSDYKVIRTGPKSNPYQRPLRPVDLIGVNMEHRAFIETELRKAKDKAEKVVVFTHHGPSFASRTDAYPPGLLDYAYYNTCKLEDLIYEYEPLLWVHGHSHHPVDIMMGNTRILNNSRGYSNHPAQAESSDFRELLVVTL